MAIKGRAADWVAVAAGVLLAVSWIWHGMLGPEKAAMFILALLIVLSATMSITRPGLMASEAVVFALGGVVFVLPWLMEFTLNTGAAWTAWILGLIAMIAGITGSVQASEGRYRRPVAH